jgi:hypothetical protein
MSLSISGFTALSDVIEPQVWNDYVLLKTTELSRFRQSGILVDLSQELMTQMAGPTVNMPYFNDLTGNDDVLDDTNDLAVNSITTGKDIAVKLARGKAFGASDLSADLSGGDPMSVIGNRFANFWVRKEQAVLLNVVAGALGSVANAGYNSLDISGLTGTAANFDPHGFIDACGQLGDHQDALAGVAVHSDTYKVMKKQDLIDFIKPSDGGEDIPVYQGKFVIVDDGMPKSGSTYTTYIFGPGAIGYATASPRRPVGFERRELVGGGMEFLVHRRYLCMHLRGVKWVGTPAGNSPTNAELATIGNWTKLYDNKLIRVVQFKHKLGS